MTDTRIADNLKRVRDRITEAALRAGRRPGDVTLVAVTKQADLPAIAALVAAGQRILAENRVQALRVRVPALAADATVQASLASDPAAGPLRWHMIGHLQRNKARDVAPLVGTVHSVDSLRLAEELSTWAARRAEPAELARACGAKGDVPPPGMEVGRGPLEVLLEVNVAGEQSKEGVTPAEAPDLAERVAGLPGLVLRGLMTMAPFEDDPERTRPVFAGLRGLRDRIAAGLPAPARAVFTELSMGMSNDFPVAVGEGATLVRVGTALFA